MRRWALAVVAALVAALAVPALSAAVTVGRTHLLVTPGHPGTRSVVLVRFRQPAISGLVPGQRASETLLVTGPVRDGCASGSDLGLRGSATGSLMRVSLRPARLTGHRWCVGVHRVALLVASRSPCPIGPGRVICPQLVTAPVTVAAASFRIAAR